MSASAINTNRNASIDIYKAICIFFIIITHYPFFEKIRFIAGFPFWIDMAVPIFMVISGYVNYKSYDFKNVSGFGDAYNIREIIRKQIRYIIPALIFIITGYLITKGTGIAPEGNLGPGSYYVPIMIEFVFVFPLIFFVIKKFGALGLFLCGGFNLLFEIFKTSIHMGEGMYRYLIFRYLLLIAFGCFIASARFKMNKFTAVILTLVGAGFIILFSYTDYEPIILNYWSGTSFLPALFIVPLMAFLIIKCNGIHNKVLEVIGKASYEIYLTQMVFYNILGGGWNRSRQGLGRFR